MISEGVADVAGRHRAQAESIKVSRWSDLEIVVRGGEVPPIRVPQIDVEGVVVVASEEVDYLKSYPVISWVWKYV